MTKAKYIDKIERLRPIIRGRYREIAESIDMPYNRFTNYVNGAGNDLEVYEEILKGINDYIESLKEYIGDWS